MIQDSMYLLEKVYISSGTGFLVSEEGHIVTSYHIVEDAKFISWKLALETL